jgi:peroxiredoxin
VELQSRLAEFEQANTSVFAISYDPVEVLAGFAEQHGISFPLLSDPGSVTIKRLGLLNQHVAEQQAFYGRGVEPRHEGIPYPGLFMLDENGVIVSRQFEQSYRVRPAPDVLLEELVPLDAIGSVVSAQASGEGVRFVAWLAADTYRPYELLHLHLNVRLAEGNHLYAAPAPDGITGLSIELEPIANMEVQPLEAPHGNRFDVQGMPEALVFEGDVTVTLPFHIDANEGDQTLEATVRYQVCTESVCFPPGSATFRLPIRGLDMLRA